MAQNNEAALRSMSEAELCYRMKRWPRHQFRREAEQEGQLQDAVGTRPEGIWPAFCRELFGRLYGVGTKRKDQPSTGAEWAEELHHQCDSLPEWGDLQGRVGGDPWRAGMGAGIAAQILSDRVPQLPEEEIQALEAELEILDEAMNKDGKRRASGKLLRRRGQVQARLKGARQQAQDALSQLRSGNGFASRSALRSAAQQAMVHLDEVDEAIGSFGAGLGMGQLRPREIAMAVAKDDRLRRIALIAGRLRVQAIEKQRTKVTPGVGEIQDVEMGSALGRLLPMELMNLTSNEGTALLARKLNEQSALQYRLQGRDTKARGPIFFLIDSSGSMGGPRSEWAAACALAIMEIARRQKRRFAVCYFDDGITGSYYFNDPAMTTFEDLLPILMQHSGGGTHIATAIDHAADVITGNFKAEVFHKEEQVVEMADGTEQSVTVDVNKLRQWQEGERADVILVTDGDDYSDVKPPIDRLKEAGASVYTIAIECEPQGGLVKHSTEVVRMRGGSDLEQATPKLDGVFSI